MNQLIDYLVYSNWKTMCLSCIMSHPSQLLRIRAFRSRAASSPCTRPSKLESYCTKMAKRACRKSFQSHPDLRIHGYLRLQRLLYWLLL